MSQFKPYPAYKDSGVEWLGEVPEHWVLAPIKHLALLNPRKSEFYGDPEQLCSFVPMEKLKTGCVLLDEERPINVVIGGYTYFEDGDVLQAKVTPCFENKNVAIAKGLTNGIGFGSTEISVLRPYDSIISGFLYYRVQEDSYMSVCTSSMIGAGGLKRVPADVINNFKVAAPALPEQTQIARFLDHETARIDALIEEQQRLIELLKEKRQAVISHAVTKGLDPSVPMKDSGVEWLGEVPAHWDVVRLKNISRIVDCKNRTPEYVDDGDYLVVRTSNIKKQQLSLESALYTDRNNFEIWTERGVPPPGSIFFTREAPSGEVCIVPDDVPLCMGQRMMNIIPSDSSMTPFIFDFLTSDCLTKYIESEASGSTVVHLRVEQVYNIPLVVPPESERDSIDKLVGELKRQYETLIKQSEVSTALLYERRSALISAAVTGKIDLRGWQPPANTPAPLREQETA
ncbi:restriction endonuclease subunit S [Azotobacter chroococcum]|uniref:Type I restriction enzyme S subunit n=1 Tax=Azotobacter chroococcum TaxID=353 RepID=A0A4R1PJZ1_9GAMM|nr:restriction endonuclease subunit S [Azotobacter chroococcum]TBV96839.1 restriction endonuclease subunit S [Azotobacter chroococcum]TCL27439.1 type I restriction enzyme S subunit [Azotobacter chroococcum]